MSKILVVDDDRTLCGTVESWLKYEQHNVDLAHTYADAAQFLKTYTYDAIILDILLPDGNGVDLLAQFRRHKGNTRVLMLTGRGELEHKEAGYDAGADDYLTKPFHMKELSFRLRALLRRSADLRDDILSAGDLVLNSQKREVTIGGERIELFRQEFVLLEYFMLHPGQAIPIDVLINQVWRSDAGVSPDALRTLVARLRKKIGINVIETVHGVGYKFLAEK